MARRDVVLPLRGHGCDKRCPVTERCGERARVAADGREDAMVFERGGRQCFAALVPGSGQWRRTMASRSSGPNGLGSSFEELVAAAENAEDDDPLGCCV